MSLGKQAKILTESQQKLVIAYLSQRRHSERNLAMFLLSVDAGLRAKEISALRWEMLTDAQGRLMDEMRLPDRATKGRSGGAVYLSKRLAEALSTLGDTCDKKGFLLRSQRDCGMTAQVVTNWFFSLYREMGFDGCSSHSGRRTAITRWARKIGTVGGSMRDVQRLARHSSLAMTQRYIEVSEDAMRRVVS